MSSDDEEPCVGLRFAGGEESSSVVELPPVASLELPTVRSDDVMIVDSFIPVVPKNETSAIDAQDFDISEFLIIPDDSPLSALTPSGNSLPTYTTSLHSFFLYLH